jgi:hypothetical protein
MSFVEYRVRRGVITLIKGFFFTCPIRNYSTRSRSRGNPILYPARATNQIREDKKSAGGNLNSIPISGWQLYVEMFHSSRYFWSWSSQLNNTDVLTYDKLLVASNSFMAFLLVKQTKEWGLVHWVVSMPASVCHSHN